MSCPSCGKGAFNYVMVVQSLGEVICIPSSLKLPYMEGAAGKTTIKDGAIFVAKMVKRQHTTCMTALFAGCGLWNQVKLPYLAYTFPAIINYIKPHTNKVGGKVPGDKSINYIIMT